MKYTPFIVLGVLMIWGPISQAQNEPIFSQQQFEAQQEAERKAQQEALEGIQKDQTQAPSEPVFSQHDYEARQREQEAAQQEALKKAQENQNSQQNTANQDTLDTAPPESAPTDQEAQENPNAQGDTQQGLQQEMPGAPTNELVNPNGNRPTISTEVPAQNQAEETSEESELNATESIEGMPVFNEADAQKDFSQQIKELNDEVLNREYYKVFIYEDRDRRDPFMPILPSRQSYGDGMKGPSGLLQYDLGQLTLKAIAWNSTNPKALIRDPKNNVYTVQVKDAIGRNNGYVETIREGEVIVIESRQLKGGKKYYSTQILRVGR